jgi:hypothetical protein
MMRSKAEDKSIGRGGGPVAVLIGDDHCTALDCNPVHRDGPDGLRVPNGAFERRCTPITEAFEIWGKPERTFRGRS